jgi:diguanylate cyclase (GGDEF)-like protein/PAS domain S-box-containing protein
MPLESTEARRSPGRANSPEKVMQVTACLPNNYDVVFCSLCAKRLHAMSFTRNNGVQCAVIMPSKSPEPLHDYGPPSAPPLKLLPQLVGACPQSKSDVAPAEPCPREASADVISERSCLQTFACAVPGPAIVTDLCGTVLAVNDQAASLFGQRVCQLLGKAAGELGPTAEELGLTRGDESAEMLHADGIVDQNHLVVDAGGTERWFDISHRLLSQDGCDRVLHATIAIDVTDRKRMQDALVRRLDTDSLTGLPSPETFYDTLADYFKEGKTPAPIALLIVEIAQLSMVTESLGPQVGDRLMAVAAEELSEHLSSDQMVVRLATGQFAVMLPHVGRRRAEAIAKRILACLSIPIRLQSRTITPIARIGIASNRGVRHAATLMQNAHAALRQLPAARAGYAAYETDAADGVVKLDLIEDLRHAVERKELFLEYQPIVDVGTGRIIESEALVRWRRSDGSILPPSEFISLAEESGIIDSIGEWVLHESCKQLKKWQSRHQHHRRLGMSLNLSLAELCSEAYVRRVMRTVGQLGLEPESLTLEVTESIGLGDLEMALDRIKALHTIGIRIAIDDFGKGYSSMASIARLPLNTLKIDREFTSRIGASSEDDAIARSIVNLGRALNLRVTAEGVETWEQLSLMRSLGCDCIQGYLLACPLSPEAMDELLTSRASFYEIVDHRHELSKG